MFILKVAKLAKKLANKAEASAQRAWCKAYNDSSKKYYRDYESANALERWAERLVIRANEARAKARTDAEARTSTLHDAADDIFA